MRSTLLALALTLECLSATRAGAASSLTVQRNAYACDSVTLTRNFFALAARGDDVGRQEMDRWMEEARHLSSRPCRWFRPSQAVAVVIPDNGDGFTCVSRRADQLPNDKLCYWAMSEDLR